MDGFTALADPTRRRILEMLRRGDRAAGAFTAAFDMTPPAVSQHLKVLREARLVRVRAEGQRRIYSLDSSGWDELDSWFERMRRFWTERLDALERELARPTPDTRARRKS